jgi:hypothetical protein
MTQKKRSRQVLCLLAITDEREAYLAKYHAISTG